MKRVVSVSLGAAAGNFVREIAIRGETVQLAREGMDGDMERAKARLRELDGHVDAIGLGGIDITLRVGDETFVVGDGKRLAEVTTVTPVVDGSGLKETLEREAVASLTSQGLIRPGLRVLLVSAMDRFGMAEALMQAGCHCLFGDLIFNLGIDYPLTTLAELEDLARKYRSRLLTVPFHLLYPTGRAQTDQKPDARFQKYYDEADLIAGDRHLICRHLPDRLTGKAILTNTTRPDTMQRFQAAGIAWVATTTPDLGGVSGGTNLMEAALIAVMGKPADAITIDDYRALLKEMEWHGAVHRYEELREGSKRYGV